MYVYPRIAVHETNDQANHRPAPVSRETRIERRQTNRLCFGDDQKLIATSLVPGKPKYVEHVSSRTRGDTDKGAKS